MSAQRSQPATLEAPASTISSHGSSIPFSVLRGHFYNTLVQFDWGRLRALAEELQLYQQSPRLFLQQFQLPGVYVFRLSSNQHRKMVCL